MSTIRNKYETALLNYLKNKNSLRQNIYVEEVLPKPWLASVMSNTNKNKYGSHIKMYYNINLNRFYTYNPYTKVLQSTNGGSKSTRKKRKNGVKTSHVNV